MLLSNKLINFMVHIHSNGGTITKKTQYLHALQYYTMCWHLRDNGLIKEKGIGKDGQKIWEFTEKGERLSELLVEVKRVMNG